MSFSCALPSCNKQGAKSRCGGCKSVHYCNNLCQKAHWKRHKKICKKKQKKKATQTVFAKGFSNATSSSKYDNSSNTSG